MIFTTIILSGFSSLGGGLASIFAGVIVLFVGVYLFRKGLHWIKNSSGVSDRSDEGWTHSDYPYERF